MIVALYVIGSTSGLLLLAARLHEARDELSRLRGESDARDQAVREEYAAYAHGITMSLACLLAGLSAARWYAQPRPAGRTPRPGQAETAPDREAAR